jgi:hypothetical protein
MDDLLRILGWRELQINIKQILKHGNSNEKALAKYYSQIRD